MLPFAATWMDLEGIMRSAEVRERLYAITFLWDLKKYNKLVNVTKKKQTHGYKEQTSGSQWGVGREEGPYKGRGIRGTSN